MFRRLSDHKGFSFVVPVIIAGIAALVTVFAVKHKSSAPTPVAAVADAATRIQQSGNIILHGAESATSVQNPAKPGVPLVSRQQLDQVALATDKLGRAGLTLQKALADYSGIKAAGGDLTAQRVLITQSLSDATDATKLVGKTIPPGTVQVVDQAIADVLSAIALIKAGGL